MVVDAFVLDETGNPVVAFTRFGGAGPWHSTAVYRLQDGDWIEVYDPGTDFPIPLFAPAADGAIWIVAETIYRVADGQQVEMGTLRGIARHVAVDGSGKLWIGGEGGLGPALWWIAPEE